VNQDATALSQRLMWIVWPAFLMAGVLEIVVFAMVDPADLHWLGSPVEMSRQGIYAMAFFVFWAITIAGGAMTTLLAKSPFEVNRGPLPRDSRPEARAEDCPRQGTP
jgi:hypothetical protein